jgi:hypothetical protein
MASVRFFGTLFFEAKAPDLDEHISKLSLEFGWMTKAAVQLTSEALKDLAHLDRTDFTVDQEPVCHTQGSDQEMSNTNCLMKRHVEFG